MPHTRENVDQAVKLNDGPHGGHTKRNTAIEHSDAERQKRVVKAKK